MSFTAALGSPDIAKSKAEPKRFKVDLWATGMNLTEIGIMKRTQHEAASDQFTKDMDIIGQVKYGSERTGLIAYRKELWKSGEGMKRRLVIKLFNENMGWRGTLDMMMGRSLQLSIASRRVPVTAFSLNLARHDQLVQLERSANKWPLLPEKFSFFIETNDGPRFYRLRRNVIAVGRDYTLYDDRGRKVGSLNHKVINLGGSWIVKLDPKQSYAKLEAVLQLFCAMLRFNGQTQRHVHREVEQMLRGRSVRQLDTQERNLYTNPRRTR